MNATLSDIVGASLSFSRSLAAARGQGARRKRRAVDEAADTAFFHREAKEHASNAIVNAAHKRTHFAMADIELCPMLSAEEATAVVNALLSRALKVGAITLDGDGVWIVNSEDDLCEAVLSHGPMN